MLNKLINTCRLLYWVVKLVTAVLELASAIYAFIEVAINYSCNEIHEKIRVQICSFEWKIYICSN